MFEVVNLNGTTIIVVLMISVVYLGLFGFQL